MDYLQVWKKLRGLSYDELPEDVVTVARHCVLDWFGCAVAGSRQPAAEILRDLFGQRTGNSTVIGSGLKLEAPTAALLNGTAGHLLDYDDTGALVGCHSTAPVLPAALALAEELGSSGPDLMMALITGVEVEGRIFRAIGRDHYLRGWHSTATLGTFGATAAASWLLGLGDEEFAVAMGLAASHAGGVKANFGTMTKPYHPGRAAESGVNCARLAAAGFTANPDAVLGNQGFVRAASSVDDRTLERQAAADGWMILGTLFKYHAACHLTHSAIENICQLRERLELDDLLRLTIRVSPILLDVCGILQPRTGLECKFSLRGTASLALNRMDTSSPDTYVDEVVHSPAIQGMIDRVEVETDRSLTQFQSQVIWTDTSRQAHESWCDLSAPATDLTVQAQKLDRKFFSLCRHEDGEGLHSRISQLDRLSAVRL